MESGFELHVLKGEDRGRRIPLTSREAHLGRRTAGAQDPNWVYFAEPTVSRHHATLLWDETRQVYTLYHKSKTNSTLVNGKAVQHCVLYNDDTVQCGLLLFSMRYVGEATGDKQQYVAPQPGDSHYQGDSSRSPNLFRHTTLVAGSLSTADLFKATEEAESQEAAPAYEFEYVYEPEATSPEAPFQEEAEGPPDEEEVEDNQASIATGLRLSVILGPDRGSVYPLDKPVLFIGKRDGLLDPRSVNGILLKDPGLPLEHVLLVWNERERTYGAILADTSTVVTRLQRREGRKVETLQLNNWTQTLLRIDDTLTMGETALRLQEDVDPLEMPRPIAAMPLPAPHPDRDGPEHDEAGRRRDVNPYAQAPRKLPVPSDDDEPEPVSRPGRPALPAPSTTGRAILPLQPARPAPESTPSSEADEASARRPKRLDLPVARVRKGDPLAHHDPESHAERLQTSSGEIAEPPQAAPEGRRLKTSHASTGSSHEDTRPVLVHRREPGAHAIPELGDDANLPEEDVLVEDLAEDLPEPDNLPFPTMNRSLLRNLGTRPGAGSKSGATPGLPPRPTPPSSTGHAPQSTQAGAKSASTPPPTNSEEAEPEVVLPPPPSLRIVPSRSAAPSPSTTSRRSTTSPAHEAAPESASSPEGLPTASSGAGPTRVVTPPQTGPAPGTRNPALPKSPAVSTPSAPGLPARYVPPELTDDEDEQAPPTFGQSLGWNYRADFVLGFQEGPNRGEKVELLLSHLDEGQSIHLGSGGERLNDIEIDDAEVDNQQASLVFSRGRFTLVNESTTETLDINGFPVDPERPALLKTGDRIACGSTVLVFLERKVMEVLSRVELLAIDEATGEVEQVFDLLKEVVVLGRNTTCDLAFDDPDMARKHAAITLREGAFYLMHLSNTGSTFLNGVSLPKGRERQLTLGDRIRLSDRVLLELAERELPGQG